MPQQITPAQIRYEEYIASEDWSRQRDEAFARWGRFCNACSSARRLHVHHLFYRDLQDCIPEDLMPLCEECHDAFHAINPSPYSVHYAGDHFEKRRTTIGVVLRWRLNVFKLKQRDALQATPKPFSPAPPKPRVILQPPEPLLTGDSKQARNNLLSILRKRDRAWLNVGVKWLTGDELRVHLSHPELPAPRRPIYRKSTPAPFLQNPVLSPKARVRSVGMVRAELHRELIKNERDHDRLATLLAMKINTSPALLASHSAEHLQRVLDSIEAKERNLVR